MREDRTNAGNSLWARLMKAYMVCLDKVTV